MVTPGQEFAAEVFDIVAQIPRGRVATYGAIARLIGCPNQARRVGCALGNAPAEVPCHRVVNSVGRTAPGWSQQRELLEAEGVRFRSCGRVDLRQVLWEVLRKQ